jgi:hypothetical protein
MGEEVSVFEGLNYRHQMLLEKLFEVDKRLHRSTISLGGEYPLKENKTTESITDGSHINNYANQLNNMESVITEMFNHIEVLEYLVRK